MSRLDRLRSSSGSTSPKNLYSYGRYDSGISSGLPSLLHSTPMDAESEGIALYNNRPKLMVQGSLEDVENQDSGILMGEEETFTDSARPSSGPAEIQVPMDIDNSTLSKARSISPKSLSDSEGSREETRNTKYKRLPRLPKKVVPSSFLRGEKAAPKSAGKSNTTKVEQSRTLTDTSSISLPSETFTYNNTHYQNKTIEQRVPPMSGMSSNTFQHLRQYLNFFIPDKEGDTGFHLAVIHNQPDLLDTLLFLMSKEASLLPVINEQNGLYQTALHLATHTQHLEMIRKLLIAGASVNITDHKGNTPLHIAARFRSTRTLEELLRYASLQTILEVSEIKNNEGQSCFHVAAKNGNLEVMGKLRSIGIDVNIQDLNCGKTPLHLATEKSSLTEVQFLLETCEADVNSVTFSGCSPLHIAAGRGDIAIVAYLISMGADPEMLTDEGDLALDLAGSEQVMLFLTRVSSFKWMY